jgi:PQQ-dependent catabolism-associated beta-propeller protein
MRLVPVHIPAPSVSTAFRRAPWALALCSLLAACSGERGAPGPVVGFVVPASGGESARQGLQLGIGEAERAGRLVGDSLRLVEERAGSPAEVEAAGERLVRRGAVALIGGFDPPSCQRLSEVAEEHDVLYLNIGCRADALRNAGRRRTLHVEASDSAYRAAGAGAVLWHGGLSRYGAAQLNERFRRRFGAPAGSEGWAGWMAVKVLWESLQRTDATDAGSLLAFLEARAEFDGHKGAPLRFDTRTHQLQQPLFPPPGRDDAGRDVERSATATPPADLRLGAGPYLFVSNEGSGDISVVDLTTNRPVARVPLGTRPRGIQLAPDGRRLYVALSDAAPTAESDADAIAAIDLERGGSARRHPAGTDPEQFAIGPRGDRLYTANEDAGTATVTDLQSGRELATLIVGVEPEGVAASPDGRWVYVTAETSNTVSVIDTRRNEVVASFLVDVRPRGVAFSPDGSRAYVTNEISGTVSIVDAERHLVLATVPLRRGAKPVGVVVSPDGQRVYVATGHAHSVSVIDAAARRVIADVPVGRRPWGIAVSPDGRWIYTANGGSNDVSVVDASRLATTASIPAGTRPWGVAVRGARSRP